MQNIKNSAAKWYNWTYRRRYSMIQKAARFLASFVECTGFINENPHITIEMIVFGCNILISTFLGWFTVLILSFQWRVFLEGAIFVISFSLIRSFAGGVHAKHSEICLSIYVGIFILTAFLVKAVKAFWIVELLAAGMFIPFCYFAPQGTIRNEVPDSKIPIKKRKSIIIVILLFLIFSLVPISSTCKKYGIFAILWCELMVVIGALQKAVRK